MPSTDVLKTAAQHRRAMPKSKQIDMLLWYAEHNKNMNCKLAGTACEVRADDDGYDIATRHYSDRAAVRNALTSIINR